MSPFDHFREVFTRASERAPFDPTAASLATVTAEGRPTARMVLVRRVDATGFLFFTNYGSRKAAELDAHPFAALCFHWYWIEEQVRVEGSVQRATPAESDEYFATRERGSQLGAWASRQSNVLASRDELESRYLEFEREFAGRDVPRPPFWGGYRITPDRVEFWKGATYRLHDRLVYIRDGAGWATQRLYP